MNMTKQMMAPVRRAVQNMVSRAVLRLVNDAGGIQAVQIGLLRGETRDNAERFQDFGFSSTPLPGAECVVVFVGGNRDHPLVVKVDDRRYRLKANAGGATMYDAEGNYIHIKNDGTIEINSSTRVDITSPLVRMTGDLEVVGDITDRVDDNPSTVHGMRETYNIHTHSENNSGDTEPPTQPMPA